MHEKSNRNQNSVSWYKNILLEIPYGLNCKQLWGRWSSVSFSAEIISCPILRKTGDIYLGIREGMGPTNLHTGDDGTFTGSHQKNTALLLGAKTKDPWLQSHAFISWKLKGQVPHWNGVDPCSLILSSLLPIIYIYIYFFFFFSLLKCLKKE